ncbi:MAG TPA: SagB/ThcOx family dehydrogenase [Candidatus Omnitrophota bacterium]|nr:SagB/ThcOx family dehydrogenase [Candidatus Omnitrophota bacterium]
MSRKLLAVFLLLVGLAGTALSVETIRLPMPKTVGKMTLEESLYRRRSQRSFAEGYFSNDQISQLLWAAQGITDTTWGFRTAPSAGAAYPLELYLVKPEGVYHYVPQTHSLELHIKGDKRPSLARAALGQSFIGDASINIVVCSVADRTREKFGLRTDRYVHMEAGHAAQNVLLQATAMGLGAIGVGSFWDDVVMATLELPYGYEPLYIIAVGYIK